MGPPVHLYWYYYSSFILPLFCITALVLSLFIQKKSNGRSRSIENHITTRLKKWRKPKVKLVGKKFDQSIET